MRSRSQVARRKLAMFLLTSTRRSEEARIMNIGEPLRIIEVEPLWIPLPGVEPAPVEQPGPEPVLEPEPAVPRP